MVNNSWGNFFVAGDNVTNTYNNSTLSELDESVIAWNETQNTSSKYIRRINTDYDCIRNLGQNGIMPVISNGYSLSEIRSLIFNNNSLPYTIYQSSVDFTHDCEGGGGGGDLNKESTDDLITYCRSGNINKKGIEFIFNCGDIIVDDSVVSFIPLPDTVSYRTVLELNSALQTNSFYLGPNSSFRFSNIYYVLFAEKADTILTDNDEVSFKVELVKKLENLVVGTFDQIVYKKNNLYNYDNTSYQVDCSGIIPGEYFLRLVTDVLGAVDLNLSFINNYGTNLQKKELVQILPSGRSLPQEYELSYNYPNPFNPLTTINYQISKDGFVTLKIYDILGSELKTLVNGYKTIGRYSVNFDASNLASGIYIYRLQAGDFVVSRKMNLIK